MKATKETIVIEVLLQSVQNRTGSLVSHSNYYSCNGPDGTRFTNSRKGSLLTAIRRRYPENRVELNITDRRVRVNA